MLCLFCSCVGGRGGFIPLPDEDQTYDESWGEGERTNEMTLIAGVYGMLRKPIVQTSPTILHHPNGKAMVKNSLTAKKNEKTEISCNHQEPNQ